MEIWFAASAWLGDDAFEENVRITTADGVITSITPDAPPDDNATRLDIVLPGFVTAHSHAFHRALRGRTHQRGGDFWAWRQPMYELATSLTPKSYYRLAVDVFGEMVRSGYTTVGEFHYVHHRPGGEPYSDPNAMGLAVADAAESVGIRLTLLDTLYLTAGVGGEALAPEQERFSDGDAESWSDRVRSLADHFADHPLIDVGVAAHSVRAVPLDALPVVASTARAIGGPLHIHVSEQPAENDACIEVHGATPIELLDDHGVLGPTTTLVHATHLTDDDIARIAASGSIVCFCPTTEADLGDGIGPAAELVASGVTLCTGSDSNAVIDPLREMWGIEQHDRLRRGERGLHAPSDLLRSATTAGMRSLGWPDGGLAPGQPADFVSLSADGLDLAGTPADLPAVVSAATRAAVTDVVVAGTRLVQGAS